MPLLLVSAYDWVYCPLLGDFTSDAFETLDLYVLDLAAWLG